MTEPKIGEDGLVFEDRPLSASVLQAIPTEVGLWKTPVVYSCLEANEDYIVVGSEQGHVWVIDLQTSKLIREYSEFRGSTITVLKLCPTRDLLAYGTSDGHVRVEKVSRPMSNKWRVQEKVKQAVQALEWRGDELFCGFDLGRVIQIRVNIHDGTLSRMTFPENYGSPVTQLSCKGDTLIVSTIERTWVVDTESHKLEQMGRKDRKPGPYGGCLVQGGEKACVARPGLRLWSADSTGKVLSTVVFKEALSTRHLPRVPLHSWSSLIPAYNKAWQFSSVFPWVGEHFIVTLTENTLFVLSPENGLIVGVLALGHHITDVSITRGFIYILCNDLKKPVCRISVKQSFLRALKRVLPPSPAHSPKPTRSTMAIREATTGSTLTVPSHSDGARLDVRQESASKPTCTSEEAKDVEINVEVTVDRNEALSTEVQSSPEPTSCSHDGLATKEQLTSQHGDTDNVQTDLSTAVEEPPEEALARSTGHIPQVTSNSLCEYMDDDAESLDGLSPHPESLQETSPQPIDIESEIQTQACTPNVLSQDTNSRKDKKCEEDGMASQVTTEPECLDSFVAEPTDNAMISLADMIDTAGFPEEKPVEEQHGASVESDPHSEPGDIAGALSTESTEQPADAEVDDTPSTVTAQEQLDDGSEENREQASACNTAPQAEQTEKASEPTLQEALQHVKAEMKDLFKFDKLSTIFKVNNPGSQSPKTSRLRVLASRNKKPDSKDPSPAPDSQDMSVHIEDDTQVESNLFSEQSENKTDQDQAKNKPDLKEILKLGRISNLLTKDTPSGDTPSATATPSSVVTPAPLNPEEQERRLRMSLSKAEEEDDVVVVKKDKKKKRKRKHKKLSSATSSVSVSLEKLTEIEEENDDSPTTLSTITTPLSLSQAASPLPPFTLTEEQTTKLEQLKLERNEDSKAMEEEQPVLESLPERQPEEEMGEESHISSSDQPQEQVSSTDQLLEALSSTDRPLDTLSSTDQPPEDVSSTNQPREEVDDSSSKQQEVVDVNTAPHPVSPAVDVEPNSSPPPQSSSVDAGALSETEDVPLFEDTDSPTDPLFADEPAIKVVKSKSASPGLLDSVADSQEKSITTTLGDLSDNPLYHDSVELQRSEKAFDSPRRDFLDPPSSRIRATLPKCQPSQLQPAQFDPLQSDDSYEGVFGRDESDKLVDSTPVNLRPRLMTDTHEVQYGRHNRPSPIVSGSWGAYVPHGRERRELSVEPSDSDEEEENLLDSQVVPDFYQLCGSLVRHSNQSKEAKASAPETQKFSWTASEFQRDSVIESDEEEGEEGPTTNADIWVPIPHPGRSHLQCICLSDSLLWVVDGRGGVFCTTTTSKGRDWQLIKKPMQQVCSSTSGKIVWGVHHHNAYVRLGIGLNPAGSTWKNTTKGTFMSRKIKRLAVSENGVWAITTDNRTIFRKGVEETNPEGRVWQEVSGEGFTHVSCCRNIVWAHTSLGKVFIRDGITPSMPSGKKWMECKCPKLTASCLTSAGVAWGINSEGSIGFRCGVTTTKPSGKGPWWEVKINALTHPSSPYNSLWQVMGSEGSHLLTSVTNMLPHITYQSKPLILSAASKAGVIILQDGNRLHACWRTATGYHYRPASKNGLFPLTTWANIASGSTGLWLVRDDGDLYCLTDDDKLKRIECPSAVKHLASSSTCLWIVADNLIWSRQGLSPEIPEGVSFDYIEVSPLIHERKIRHISCGKTAVWALDKTGVPHFRFGVHSREPGTGMSPAWIPVEDIPSPLYQISVCSDNWLVWACDEKFNCYVRTGVTHDFPIGRKWELVPSEQIKEVCVTNEYVYGLTPSGELLCRYGITEENIQGNYWRRMPGRYEHLTTGRFGELWTLDTKGQVWKQEWKILAVSHDPKSGQGDFETSMIVDQSWEVV